MGKSRVSLSPFSNLNKGPTPAQASMANSSVDRAGIFYHFIRWYCENNKKLKGLDWNERLRSESMECLLSLCEPMVLGVIRHYVGKRSLQFLMMDRDDMAAEIYQAIFRKIVPKFDIRRTYKFDFSTFYNYLERGCRQQMFYLTRRNSTLGDNYTAFGSFVELDNAEVETGTCVTDDKSFDEIAFVESKTDIILRISELKLAGRFKEIADFIVSNCTLDVLFSNENFSKQFPYPTAWRWAFIEELKKHGV